MFGIGFPELILILIIGLVVFGPGKLPEIGRAVGKGLQEFKKATSSISNEINNSTVSNNASNASITPTQAPPPNPANPNQPAQPPVFMQNQINQLNQTVNAENSVQPDTQNNQQIAKK